MFVVSGNVITASGNSSGTAVFILVINPSNTLVAFASAQVSGNGAVGVYSHNFTAGGSTAWIVGTYTVTVFLYDTVATLGAPAATSSAVFRYSVPA
ncbi:MAG: hypothetical protein LYZ69_03115 [Nitrososphaerales archaeon]|nr:hypothetical protein [Nitrososphaerales archaeon]